MDHSHEAAASDDPISTIASRPSSLNSAFELPPLNDYSKVSATDGPRELSISSDHGKQHGPGFLAVWWLEMLCCLLLIGALLAIVGTLWPFHGKPLPSWPYGLSINTLISVYIVIVKTGMAYVLAQGIGQLKWSWFQRTRPLIDVARYDNASRGGLLGSIDLLWGLRGRSITATIGALLTILALLMDPFTQQLIRYYPCQINLPNPSASIPRTTMYTGGGGVSYHIGAGRQSLPYQMQGAIANGIYSPGSTQVPYNCSTGNCTFPDRYASVGYCSQCEDVSDQVHANESVNHHQFSIPSGLTAESGLSTFVMSTSYAGNYLIPGRPAIVEMVFGYPGLMSPCYTDWSCRGYGAARCTLGACVREYQASIEETHLTETLVDSTAPMAGWGVQGSYLMMNMVDLTCVDSNVKATLRSQGYNFTDATRWLGYNVSIATNETQNGAQLAEDHVPAPVHSDCLYRMDMTHGGAMNQFFSDFFTGNVTFGLKAQGGTNQLQAIFQQGNISFASVNQTFQNVSTAITNFMRQNGNPKVSTQITGFLSTENTCVRVRWWWLAFPVALATLTLCFFAATVAEASAGHDFKASVLPLMFHGLELTARDVKTTTTGRTAEVAKDAKDIFVRFARTDAGWQFRETSRGGD